MTDPSLRQNLDAQVANTNRNRALSGLDPLGITDEQGRGIVVSREMAGQYGRESAQRQRLLSDGRLVDYQQGAAFQRSQLGRTEGEARGAYIARSMGYDPDSERGRLVMETEGMNASLRTTKQVAGEAFSGLLTDLRRGTGLASSLETVAGRIADRLLNTVADKAVSSLFGSFLGEAGSAGGLDVGLDFLSFDRGWIHRPRRSAGGRRTRPPRRGRVLSNPVWPA